MHPVRKAILDYLATGQATVSALVEGTGHRPVEIRSELALMIEDSLITEGRIECARFQITVYRLTPPPA